MAFSTSLAPNGERPDVAHCGGFSVHAGLVAGAGQRRTLERLCRYIARPAIATQGLRITDA